MYGVELLNRESDSVPLGAIIECLRGGSIPSASDPRDVVCFPKGLIVHVTSVSTESWLSRLLGALWAGSIRDLETYIDDAEAGRTPLS